MKTTITFFILLFLAFSCSKIPNRSNQLSQTIDCNVQCDKTYDLMENYFTKDQVLTHSVAIHYFTNGKNDLLSESYLHDRVITMDPYFAGANRKFKVDKVIVYDKSPDQYPKLLKKIKNIEEFQEMDRNDLRDLFHINHYQFWNQLLHEEGHINVYIYDGISDGFAGLAGGIGSTYLAMRWDYMDVRLATLEHEFGHALGLRHTHEKDDGQGFTNHDGDLVCDTPVTEANLLHFMDEHCNYNGPGFEGMTPECQMSALKNFMAYNVKKCREFFTPEQNRRMQKILENSADLRRTIKELQSVNEAMIPQELNI